MRLSRRSEPFDSDEFVYELKIDGFRALACVENGKCDLVSRKRSPALCVDHIEARGHEKVCELDLEGIVAKRKTAGYRVAEKPSLHHLKIKNPDYSHAEGREELFES